MDAPEGIPTLSRLSCLRQPPGRQGRSSGGALHLDCLAVWRGFRGGEGVGFLGARCGGGPELGGAAGGGYLAVGDAAGQR